MQPYNRSDVKNRQAQTRPREFIEIESPIPQQRALGPRRPLALMFGGSVSVLAVWMLAILGSAASAVPGALPIVAVQGGGASVVQNANPNSVPNAPQANQAPLQTNKPALPGMLQSRSADSALPLTKRADGRTVLSNSPAVIVIYVPSNYYPQPDMPKPPTTEAAQQTAAIVQQIASANE
ncbi:MAG TPA: hypothetical protein VFG86_08440, partial [Chloroflexota bacterium]|nr:hypothetical protein [Chloroflexota bacterium]